VAAKARGIGAAVHPDDIVISSTSAKKVLRDFTRTTVEEKGWVKKDKIQKFLDAGYTKAQVFEVLMGIALKTLTNYSNHLADAQPNPEFVAMAGGKKSAA
jgi:alkylhydroperoxidase family enzyme